MNLKNPSFLQILNFYHLLNLFFFNFSTLKMFLKSGDPKTATNPCLHPQHLNLNNSNNSNNNNL